MNELLTFISAEIGAVILIAIAGLIVKWLFIRSAVKSGMEAALSNVLSQLELSEDFYENLRNHLNNE